MNDTRGHDVLASGTTRGHVSTTRSHDNIISKKSSNGNYLLGDVHHNNYYTIGGAKRITRANPVSNNEKHSNGNQYCVNRSSPSHDVYTYISAN